MSFADVHSNFHVWHDQFKTSVLAQAATFSLVAANTTPLTNDNIDIHTNVTNGKGSPAEQHGSKRDRGVGLLERAR
jgi:hypothetical protein